MFYISLISSGAAKKPRQLANTASTFCSRNVGTSGNSDNRCGAVIARMRTSLARPMQLPHLDLWKVVVTPESSPTIACPPAL